jgi:TonB family protein
VFNNLIESDSHREELARKSRFFLGTLAFYALLFSVGGVASIYAYDAHLDNQNLELVTLLTPVELTAPAATPRDERPATHQSNSDELNVDKRRELIADTNRPIAPDTVSAKGSDTPPVRDHVPTILSNENNNALNVAGPVGPTSSTGGGGPRVVNTPAVKDDVEPPPAQPATTPTPVPKNLIKSLGAVTGQMLNKPNLPYPPIAKTSGIQGAVTVQVLIDETGKVISAHAVSGHPFLRAAAEQAAYQARFSPTLLSKQPVKASGTITFNFQLQK